MNEYLVTYTVRDNGGLLPDFFGKTETSIIEAENATDAMEIYKKSAREITKYPSASIKLVDFKKI